jgi:hypothetical protein
LAKKANRQNPVDPRLGEVCLGHERLGKFIQKCNSALLASSHLPTLVKSNTDHWVHARDILIKKHRDRPDKEICRVIDDVLGPPGGPTHGLPVRWMEMYGVRTFLQAYANKTLRPLVQKMISDAKKRVIHLR